MTGELVRVILHVEGDYHLEVRKAMRNQGWWMAASAWETGFRTARMEFTHPVRRSDGSWFFGSSDDVMRSVKRALAPLGMGASPMQPAANTDAYLAALQRSMVSMTPAPVVTPKVTAAPPQKSYWELRKAYIEHGGGIAALDAMKAQVKGSVSEDGEWTWDPPPAMQDSKDPESPVPYLMRKGPDGKFLVPKEQYLAHQGLLPARRPMTLAWFLGLSEAAQLAFMLLIVALITVLAVFA